MAGDLQWRVNVEITPANATAFRVGNAAAAPVRKTLWVAGTVRLLQGGRLRLTCGKDRRLGNQIMLLTVPATWSAVEGVAGGTVRLLAHEVLLWRHGIPVRLLMSKAPARELLAAVTGPGPEH